MLPPDELRRRSDPEAELAWLRNLRARSRIRDPSPSCSPSSSRTVIAHGILSRMRKRSTKKQSSAAIGEVASGIVAAAEQDIELTAEQLEHAAERSVTPRQSPLTS